MSTDTRRQSPASRQHDMFWASQEYDIRLGYVSDKAA